MSQHRPRLLIAGGSTRAAACSALRAGLQPWCVDYFADADLVVRCPVQRITGRAFPHGLRAALADAPDGPWLFTGALENRPALIRRLARIRPLWGNQGQALALARSPLEWSKMLQAAELPAPAVCLDPNHASPDREWLVKPLKSGGGKGVQNWTGKNTDKRAIYQEFIDGQPCSTMYVGDGQRALMLGSSLQLVGVDWLNASGFKYCGNIGPLDLEQSTRQTLERIGNVLATGCGLRGIFGVDFILRDNVPWPIEINPRYTASVEVLEHGLGIAALAVHRAIFKNGLLLESNGQNNHEQRPGSPNRHERIVGKAILYAQEAFAFPAEGPWSTLLERPAAPEQLPDYADIPHAGESILPNRPILTCFASGKSQAAVRQSLRERVAELEPLLMPRTGMYSIEH